VRETKNETTFTCKARNGSKESSYPTSNVGRPHELAYTLGIVFFAFDRLRYFHATWHVFVLVGSAAHYFAILFYVLAPRHRFPAAAGTVRPHVLHERIQPLGEVKPGADR
jgi:hypothetical protein